MSARIVLIAAAAVLAAADLIAARFTPETSQHFEERIDPKSKMVGYVLKTRLGFHQQSLYFTQKSLTDDGRFLCFEVSDDDTRYYKRMAIVDFETDEVMFLNGIVRQTDNEMAYLDVQNDELWYLSNGAFYKRELLKDPQKPVLICPVPAELTDRGRVSRMFTHLTLNAAKTKAFFDVRYADDTMVQGVMDFTTGHFTPWSECRDVCINHASIHPTDDRLGLCAQESSLTTREGKTFPIRNISDGVYPRLQLVRPGVREVIQPLTGGGGATHETWAEDGRGFLYVSCGVNYHDLATDHQERLTSLYAAHANMTKDNRYLVFDRQAFDDDAYRGCSFNVFFWNRETGKYVFVYREGPALNDRDHPNHLHPDAHPTFGGADQYIVASLNDDQRRINIFVAPVAPLIAATDGPKTGAPFLSGDARRIVVSTGDDSHASVAVTDEKDATVSVQDDQLKVEKGALTLVPRPRYDWFRLIFKETYYTYTNSFPGVHIDLGTSWLTHYVGIMEWGLYDANGVRRNVNLHSNLNYRTTGELKPGQFAYVKYNGGAVTDGRTYTTPFNDNYYAIQITSGKTPKIDDESSWPMIVLRLNEGTPAIESYDIVSGYAIQSTPENFYLEPTSWTLQGSTDGQNWVTLDEVLHLCPPDYWKTYLCRYQGNRAFTEKIYQEHIGVPIAQPASGTLYSDVASLQVASGSTLTGSDTLTFRNLKVDGLDAGTLSGIRLALTGTLEIDNFTHTMSTLPGDYSGVTELENLENWKVKVNGHPFRGSLNVNDGKVLLQAPGFFYWLR